jgi:hypothetical protein
MLEHATTMTHRTIPVVAVCAVALMLAAQGCDGGHSNSSAPAEQVAEFRVTSDPSQPPLLEIRNVSDRTVTFSLIHNGQRVEPSLEAMIESVRDLPDCFEGEPLEHKLWRFVRDSVYHSAPLNWTWWRDDPLAAINSIGWDMCGGVSVTFAFLARAAGFEARVWTLEGHNVPEVLVNGNWTMYDPDLAVYYWNRQGAIASVADLESDPSLITSPIDPIFPDIMDNEIAYSDVVADIYQTQDDNLIFPLPSYEIAHIGAAFELPPGASLSYPGLWVKPIDVYGLEVPAVANLRMDLPAGWSGTIHLPLLLSAVFGNGRIRLDGTEFSIGSAELDAELDAQPAETLELLSSSSDVTLVFLLNPMRFAMRGDDYVQLIGPDVQALQFTPLSSKAGDVVTESSIEALRKPVAPCPD